MALILVADDDPVTRAIARSLLEGAGHEVVEAEDGDQALKAMRAHSAKLVVLDMFMPNKDGLETIAELRAAHPGVPILAISGGGAMGATELLDIAVRLGADAALPKPLGQTFVGRVESLL